MMLFLLDGHLKLAVLDPENAFHPPVDCKPEFYPAGAQGPVQETLLWYYRSQTQPDTMAVYAVSCTGR